MKIELKRLIETERMLDRTINAGRARKHARDMKHQSSNENYRLIEKVKFVVNRNLPAPGVSLRDFKYARQAAIKQAARRAPR